jgi:hypothetical protein
MLGSHQPYSAPLPFLTRIKTMQDAGRRLEEAWFSMAKAEPNGP